MSKTKLFTLISGLLVVAIAFSFAAVPNETVQAQDDPVQIRWFVGLGAGTDAPQIERQEALVEEFNDSQDGIELVLEIVDADQAYGVLTTQIAAGNAPDIVGPVGIRGRSAFPGVWLDLTELIEETGYDLSDFDPELVEFYNIEGEGQTGIPFAVFPSFILYNVELFEEAGIPVPPSAYGEPYIDWNGEEREWNMDTLREVAMILTVDSDGNDATMEEFNVDDIVQFGYGPQWTDIRGRLTLFGASNFIDEEGNAVVTDNWVEGMKWYHAGMWEDYFIPNAAYGGADFLGGGNWFESGNMAMIYTHMWYLPCCTWGLEDTAFQVAPVPSYNGETTAKIHGDTFAISESTDHPEEAFEVLTWMLGEKAEELAILYGGMPARLSLQEDYFDTIGNTDPLTGRDINWDVVVAGMSYGDNPSHEGPLPSLAESEDVYNTWAGQLDSEADFDVEEGLVDLLVDLQVVFDTAAN